MALRAALVAREKRQDALGVGLHGGGVLGGEMTADDREQRDLVLLRELLDQEIVAQVAAGEREREPVGQVEDAHAKCS
jgi:hypothetical protein